MTAILNHYAFPQPIDDSVPVWRYLTFAKYVALLMNRSLYFATADSFSDPYEGATSHANRQLRGNIYAEEIAKQNLTLEQIQQGADALGQIRKFDRQWTFVNCWHMNKHESEAMWNLYVPDGTGVAIRTTYRKLADALPDHVYIGTVKYIDYTSDWMPERNSFSSLMHKRLSFAHESEVRALFKDIMETDPKTGQQVATKRVNTEGGRNISFPIETAIDSVYVAPTAAAWFYNLVIEVTKNYGMSFAVHQSVLTRDPEF